MTETLLLFAGVGLLGIGAATLVVAVLVLRTARRYVDVAEERLEHLREGQARLLARLEEGQRAAEEGREEAEPDVRTRRGAERSIERTKQELLGLGAARQTPEAGPGRPIERLPGEATVPERPEETSHAEQAQETGKPRRPAGLPETRSAGGSGSPARAIRRPHPDDDVRPGSTLAGQVRAAGGSPIRMFRVFYDRYLDNYEGYVKLAASIQANRTDEERVPGSRAERGWQERLRRVDDGIRRTTERLDILEHSNPELASDDRVSRRAAIARTHAGIPEG